MRVHSSIGPFISIKLLSSMICTSQTHNIFDYLIAVFVGHYAKMYTTILYS